MEFFDAIASAISSATGKPFHVESGVRLNGGSATQAWRFEGCGERFFVKTTEAPSAQIFLAEAAALDEIAATDSVRVPSPVCHGEIENQKTRFLVLEYFDLSPHSQTSAAKLGESLAAMHRHVAEKFGWQRANSIGVTLQINTPCSDWLSFWRDQRLGFQLGLAYRNGYDITLRDQGDRLLESFGEFFRTYSPAASLLHGDLWHGNAATLATGEPVVYDPATYYGDREADLAMTELFGGFTSEFYSAYRAAFPLDAGYSTRKHFYNLYHLLNHLNIFGAAYLAQTRATMQKLLAEISA
ncbi:MAG: fructosamine kinase family protein [Burkholderiales bacterium]